MKQVPVEKNRNVAVIGHASCGKTSLVEAMLFKSGMIPRQGTVEAKNTVSDCTQEEQERQISIHSANLFLNHNGHNFFVSDTPGYADFYGEVYGSLSVADAAILVVDASNGIEVGTLQLWRVLSQKNIPRMIVVNKLDKENTDFHKTLDELVEAFGIGCVPVQIPIGNADSFSGVARLIEDEPENVDHDLFAECKNKLIETVAESDEVLMEKFFADEPLSKEEITGAMRKGIADCSVFPVAVCSATKAIGIEGLLHSVENYLPSPASKSEIPVQEGEALKPDESLPASAFVFKTVTDPFVGQLTYLRVYQGTISSGSEIQNLSKGHKERVGELMIVQGKDQIHVDTANPGCIVAIAKLKDTHVNNTLGAAKVKFAEIEFPKPVMTYAVAAAKQGQEDKIAAGLHRISEEDPTILVERHPETHEQLVSGLGDVHLDVVFKRLQDAFKVEVVTKTPKVAYHETIRGTADVTYRHKKQSGGAGQFAQISIKVRPNTRDAGYEYINKIVGGVISQPFIPSVDKGIRARMEDGIIAGCKVVDIVVELYDGKEHPVDSKDIAFQIAGRHAIAEAVEKAQPILLEPIMEVEVQCPQDFMGDINGILNSKRGQIMGMDAEGALQIIKAHVPQAEMFRFCSELRSITGGRGSFSMKLDHYSEVPPNIAQAVIDNYKKSKEEKEG